MAAANKTSMSWYKHDHEEEEQIPVTPRNTDAYRQRGLQTSQGTPEAVMNTRTYMQRGLETSQQNPETPKSIGVYRRRDFQTSQEDEKTLRGPKSCRSGDLASQGW